MDKYKHCNDCPNWYKKQKLYLSGYGYSDITMCKKYNKQLYYYANEENKTPVPCKECRKNFSYVPYIIFEKEG